MKRIILTVTAAVAMAGGTFTFAQKATLDNPWSLEGIINYSGTGGVDWKAPTIRARYFVNDNIAARVQLGLGDGLGTPMKEVSTFYENVDGSGAEGTLEINRMSWNAQIGGEYHLAGTDRLSPFFALGINFGGGSSTATFDETNGAFYVQDRQETRTGKMSMFGVGVGAGLDIYLIENLYVGFELGLSFSNYSYSDKVTELSTVPGTTDTSVTEGATKEAKLQTSAMNAGVRLGWRF
ncbi:MAG TPA: hypothetical protein VKX29_00175 [Brumimicrobium sp.]|nr:hypothetical protein [Brumimicrobium sp.]